MRRGKMELLFKFLVYCVSLSCCCRICSAVDTITSKQSILDGQELVSSGGSFILGFFSPSQSKHRYLGIWYRNISPQTIVWVGNRGRPINDSYGQLTVSADGNLILLDGAGNTIWSSKSNSARSIKEPTAKLLHSGNLVLVDGTDTNSDGYVWQSFDYPGNTLLPGMRLGWDAKTGLHRQLTSWKSADDPSPGNFTFSIDIGVLPQFVLRQGVIRKYRSGIWNGFGFNSNLRTSTGAVVPTFTFNSNEIIYMAGSADDTTTILVMGHNGFVEQYAWDKETLQWITIYEARKDRCDNYGICGPNSICNTHNLPVLCDCLPGFIPRSQVEWDAFNWAGGCIRKTQLDCRKPDGFMTLRRVKLPDVLQFWTNENMNLKECKEECLKNCKCTAYANLNVIEGGQGCLVWFGDLYDMRLFISHAGDDEKKEQDLHIRLAASDVESIADGRKKKRPTMMIVIILVVSGVLVLVSFIICFIIKERKQKDNKGTRDNLNEDLELPLFSLATVLTATDNFCCENKLGEGGFGPVYKGILAEGQEIAVKRLSETSRQGISEFKNEVMLVAKLQHRNLVKLLGVCTQGEERMLIYEHMENKSLDQFIFDSRRSKMLDWKRRLDVIVGIARGLLYLHQDSRLTIIHRDLKTSNILLDTEMNPKISDFGMARIFEADQSRVKTKRIAGTYGYMSPEYGIDGLFSVKSDVFGFGVIVLEILSGMKNRAFQHPDHHHNLLGHAWILWKEGRPLELMDVNLGSSGFKSELLKFMQVGLLCVQRAPEDRPTMSAVVFMLSNDGLTLAEPKQPGFFVERCPSCYTKEEYCTHSAVTITLVEAR
ncbi:PREDICTED: G-type lectin S-receptor-like serine/threonine-protein kinase At4g27290 [Theobroma cacao]|uniref:Receptor-like serine/threonine-protein kinase n=1 Tax=Theobroma cacao TaxID=3641 RepID=A0AB32WIT6_THECC|nr:PREDICTED: G-type lectin S-receptor-like serine/threonine-protein kinase At4g27290 [Theobroma cacao]